uniref:IQ domain-containing protein E isoform X3 n=1 Tax=Pogona vitticeps TaxID=103695 RepID=A0ABM5F0D4_9SAUR
MVPPSRNWGAAASSGLACLPACLVVGLPGPKASPAMSQGPSEAAPERELELVEDSLSALSYESDTETTLRKKTVRKSPKSLKSPYTSGTSVHSKKPGLSRPFKSTERRHFEIPLVKTSRQLWCGSPKQDTRHLGPAKPNIDLSPTFSVTLPGDTPEYLKEALGMKKPKHARSSRSGYIPGTPNYKEKEDMYDEIIELKKTIQAQKCEADRMKTKIRRLEEENSRKDKQIEQLLDSSRVTHACNAGHEVISGLKQKVLRLEQQCKQKDHTINKLQADEKNTSVEEMRVTLQTYYEEIQRLQSLLAKSEAVQRKSSSEKSQQKAFNAAVLQLSKSVKALQDENWKLKADLDHMLSSSPAPSKAKNYAEWSRPRLVQLILKLEKKIDAMQNERPQLSKTSTSPLLAASTSAQPDPSVAKESDVPEECEHLLRVVKKLKSQRAALQDQLALKEETIQKLTERRRELEQNQGVDCRSVRTHAIEPPDQGQQGVPCPCRLSSPTLMRPPRGSDSVSPPLSSPGHPEKERAAHVIQRWWKAHKTKDPDLSCGPHLSQRAAESRAEEEAVRLIQSVFRAHLTRTHMEERSLTSRPGNKRTSPATSRGEEKGVWSTFKYSPLVFTSGPTASTQAELQPSSLPPPTEEILLDDSDEIITISPSPAKKTLSLEFSDSALRSLVHF